MIKDIIFDFGQVLVKFDPMYMTSFYVDSSEDCKTVSDVVFDRVYWDRLDAGTIAYAEMTADFEKRLPKHLLEGAEKALVNWMDHLPEIEGMRELLERLRVLPDTRLFLLSNISREFADRSGDIDILKYFDGCVFSATCGSTKPNKEIFAHLCEKYGISPESAVFIEDSAKNVNGARAFGIKAVLFENAEQTERELKCLGVFK